MSKRLDTFLLLTTTLLLLQCSEAPYIQLAANRIVLVELFSSTNWGYCERAEHVLDSLQMIYGDSLVVLSYHAQDYDTFSNPVSKARARLYNPGIEPSCIFDGGSPVYIQNPDSFRVHYQDYILGARSQTTSLRMEFDTIKTELDSTQITIGVNVFPTESLADPANLRLFVVIYEKIAPYLSSFPPFDTLHAFFVVRKFLPDTLGLDLTFLNFPNSFDTVFSTQLENWDLTQIGIASFVQDIQTKKVLQAVKKEF